MNIQKSRCTTTSKGARVADSRRSLSRDPLEGSIKRNTGRAFITGTPGKVDAVTVFRAR